MQNLPLVTVIVVTYNSSSFIFETLESVSAQTWGNIELIISDDCSVDNTVEICQNWLEKNKKRFIKAEMLTSEINTGVPANANRGLKVAKGDWTSFVAGDDALKPACIEENILWITRYPFIRVLFSFVELYNNTFEAKNLIGTSPSSDPYNKNSIMAKERNADSQYKMLLTSDRIHFTPSVFLHRETLLNVGGFDERFKLLEDYPLWLNLTKRGHKLHFMNKVTVNYRKHANAINNKNILHLINPNYFRLEEFRKVYTYPFLPKDLYLKSRYNWYVSQVYRLNWLNKNNILNRFILSFLTFYFNPFQFYILLKKILNKTIKDNEFYN